MGKLKTALMILAIVVMIVIAGSMVYYFIFFRPGIEKAEVKLQEQKFQHEKDIQTQESLDKALKEEEALKETQEAIKNIKKAQALDDCLKETQDWWNKASRDIQEAYLQAWNDECSKRGLPYGSNLPANIANKLEQERIDAFAQLEREFESRQQDCYNLYK